MMDHDKKGNRYVCLKIDTLVDVLKYFKPTLISVTSQVKHARYSHDNVTFNRKYWDSPRDRSGFQFIDTHAWIWFFPTFVNSV